MNRLINRYFILALLACSFLSGLTAYADPIFRINDLTVGNKIDKHGICREIGNAAGFDIMIATQTSAEWKSFVSNASIPGITKSYCNCTCPDGAVVALGGTCTGGGKCGGTFNGNKYMVTPGGCTNSATPTCAGGTDTTQKAWRGSGGSATDIPGVENIASSNTPSTVLGDVNTAAMVAHASVSADSAADYCNDMDYGGYTDWYLPSKSELAYLFCNSDRTPPTWAPPEQPGCGGAYGFSTAFTGFASGGLYYSSTERDNSNAWAQSSNQTDYAKTFTNFYVRCVRRY